MQTAAGASDCASCVAVALELARLLVADKSRRLPTPVVFLINGIYTTGVLALDKCTTVEWPKLDSLVMK
jgi:hypothetical protein